MAHRNFWNGFAIGAAAGALGSVGSILAWKSASSAHSSRVLRLEKSIQIGRPVGDVFRVWSDFSHLARFSDLIQSVRNYGNRSHWVVTIDGKNYEWDAELEQVISNQAIGWKSLSGPKHTGRINFSPIANDTLVHVVMNYAPPLGRLSQALSPVSEYLEDVIERVLRDFKAGIEAQSRKPLQASENLATGTSGAQTSSHTQHTRFGGAQSPVEYTRPTQTLPFSQPEIKR